MQGRTELAALNVVSMLPEICRLIILTCYAIWLPTLELFKLSRIDEDNVYTDSGRKKSGRCRCALPMNKRRSAWWKRLATASDELAGTILPMIQRGKIRF